MRFLSRLAALVLALAPVAALSQSSPNLVTGQVPTAAQWNSYFAAKQDYNPNLGCAFSPCVPPIATTPNSILGTNTSGTPSFSSLLPSGMTYPSPNFTGTNATGVLSGNFSLSTSGQAQITNTTPSTSSTTGAVTIAGGLGVGGNLNVGGTITGAVTPSGGNTASPLSSILGRIVSVTDFGATCNGVTDDTAAFKATANAAAGGVFTVPANSRCLIAGTVTIPASTTLDCRVANPVGLPDNLNTIPALLVETSGGFVAGGPSVKITHCHILNPALSYPIQSSPTTSWGGIAITDNGNNDLAITHDTIVGYDTAIYITGAREDIDQVYADCTGLNHACIDVEHGNTDMGWIINSKVQPIASSTPSCSNDWRPGTGLRIGYAASGLNGISDILDHDIVQQFMQTDYDFQAGVWGGIIWGDNAATCSGIMPTYEIHVEGTGSAIMTSIIANPAQTGIRVDPGGSLTTNFLSINLLNFNGNCLSIGGNVRAGIASIFNCGNGAITFSNPGIADFGSLNLANNHGKTAPYIFSGAGTLTFGKYGLTNFSADEIASDLPNTNLFDTNFQEGVGGEHIDRLMNAPVSITSCGTSPGIVSNTTNSVGSIKPANGTTACTINFNPVWQTTPNCFIQPTGINPPLPIYINTISNAVLTIGTSTAFNGTDYFSYKCEE